MKRQHSTEKLFTNSHPQVYGYKKHAEDEYTYLNQHADAPVASARQMMEQWYSRFPVPHRNDLARRFRSKDNKQHSSAFWELYMHELLLRMNYSVEVHPSLKGVDAHPDYLLFRNDVPLAYVECRLAGMLKEEVGSAKRREAELHDALDQVHSPNFFLQVQEIRSAPVRPSFKQLAKEIEAWLATLDPDLPMEAFLVQRETGMRFEWGSLGWDLALQVIPKSVAYRGKGGRSVGMFSTDVQWLDTKGELRRAVSEKGHKYGKLDLPFLIAVNYMGPHCDRSDWTDVLYGSSAVRVRFAKDGTYRQQPFRKDDGFWLSSSGFRNTHVSGIIAGWHISPWTIGAHSLERYAHFAAERIFEPDENLPRWYLADGEPELKMREGRSNVDIMGIPEGWPGTWNPQD